MQQTFGEYIRTLREAQQMPLRKLAALLDIDQSTLSKIERNERKLSSRTIPVLADVFCLDYKALKIRFLSEQLVNYLHAEDYCLEALQVAEKQIKYQQNRSA